MKSKRFGLKQKWSRAILPVFGGLALIGSAGPSLGQDLNVNTFDYGISGIAWQNWRTYVTGHTMNWDAWQDADGNAASGSLYVTVNWPLKSDPGWSSGWNDVQVAFGAGNFAASNYIELEAYIKIDVTNSFTAGDGSYGVAGLYLNGGDGGWQQVQGYANLAATNGWQRIHGFLSAIPDKNYDQVVLGLISNGDSSPTNTIAYWIDNVRLTALPSVNTNQPPLNIAKAPPPGLTCMASAPDDAWQRQMIRTVDANYSWDTATAVSDTTTYSISLAAFPSPAYSGFEAMMYLIPMAGMPSAGPDDPSVDWDAAHVVYFTVTGNADGTAKANFRYKVNDAGAEHFHSWTDLPCSAGPLGKWSLSFQRNTNVTMTTPSGNSLTLTIPAADAANFQGGLIAYYGVRPADPARIGQSATFNRIQITGAAAAIDDSFSQGLNSTTWVRKASHAPGIFITPADAKYWLSWPTPDSGFTNVYATDSLSKKLGPSWKTLPASATGWVLVGGNKRLAVIDQSALNAAFGSTPAACFFGLWQLVP